MIRYPLTVLEFQSMFPAEDACLDYLTIVRWPEGFRCPACTGDHAWTMSSGLLRCASCRTRTSITSGTIFQDTHLPLTIWFQAAWHVVNQKNGVSALGLQKALGLGSYRTAWTVLHKLRRAMVRPGRERLSGTVEVDETFVGGKTPGKPGRSHDAKVIVVVAVEDKGQEGIGRIRLKIIRDASGPSLFVAVQEMVEPGSHIRTDGWTGYNDLPGYTHTVVEKQGIADEDATPLVHRIASLLKRWLLGTHQGAVGTTHLASYLDEFTFRFNCRTSRSRGQLFLRLMEQAVAVAPVTGASMVSV